MSTWDEGGGSKSLVYGRDLDGDEHEILTNGNGEPVTITLNQFYSYQGRLYQALEKATIASGNSIYYQIQTNDNEAKFNPGTFSSSGEQITITHFANPTLNADGTTEITTVNFNQESDNTPTVKVFNDPDVTSEGDIVDVDYIGGGTARPRCVIGGAVRGNAFFLIPANTDILVKVENGGSNEADVLSKFSWFE